MLTHPAAAPPTDHPPPPTSAQSDASSDAGDSAWDDWASGATSGSDAGEEATTSLFDGTVHPSPAAALAHDAAVHTFDVRALRTSLGLDDYGTLRLINYVRAEVGAGRDPRHGVAAAVADGAAPRPWAVGEAYLVPADPGDPLLFYDYEDEGGGCGGVGVDGSGGASDAAGAGDASPAELLAALAASRAEADALRQALATLAAASLPPEAVAALPPHVAAALADAGAGWAGEGAPGEEGDVGAVVAQLSTLDTSDHAAGAGASTCATGAGAGRAQAHAAPPAARAAAAKRAAPGDPSLGPDPANTAAVDEGYFDGYSGLSIHREMLSDAARTDAYRAALEGNPSRLRGARVMDVGAGTGVLSLFAARAGAAAVVAVEGSARMAALATRVAADNRLDAGSGGPITVVSGRVEDLKALPGGLTAVDVIVSEWMGYALYFECMLDAVLAARDRWLAPGGVLLPDAVRVCVAGVHEDASDLGFWKDVCGLDLSACGAEAKAARRAAGAVLPVTAAHLLTSSVTVHELDLATAAPGDAAFSAAFAVDATCATPAPLGGVALWFDAEFSAAACPDTQVTLSTSPHAPQTHWHQAVLELSEPLTVAAPSAAPPGTACRLEGRVSLARGEVHRSVDLSLELQGLDAAGGRVGPRHTRLFTFAMSP